MLSLLTFITWTQRITKEKVNHQCPPSNIQRRVLHIPYLLVVVLLLISGCASMPLLPSSSLQHHQLDLSPLAGKVIVIDPGHGGKYSGAVGRMGLKESEVNLGVALYLWGALQSAGAKPVMTRTADTTVASPAHKQLRADLLARSMMSNTVHPDLFVSIHHNSNTHRPKKNNLEVYYKLTDPGASRELAECIMKRIGNAFPIAQAQVLPGNYSVLRGTRATAILGEASYLTHRENERRLSLHGFLKLEAEAYFLGILDYFARGVPRIFAVTPDGDVYAQAQPEVTGWVKDDACGKGIDPSSIKLYLDDVAAEHLYDPLTGKVSYIPSQPLVNGEHTLRLEARNRGGNSAQPVRTIFSVALPPAAVVLSPIVATIPPDGRSRTRLTATVLDSTGNPVIDGTSVAFSTSAGALAESVVPTSFGKATTHLIAGFQRTSAEVVATCNGLSSVCTVTFDRPEKNLLEISIHDLQGNPMSGAELFCGKALCCVTDYLGYCFYQNDRAEELPFTVWKDGYQSLKGSFSLSGEGVTREELLLKPVDNGLMWNRVVVIDPQAEDGISTSSSAIERAEANFKTAVYLKEMLKLAGAKVFLTRENNFTPSPAERVIKADEVRSEVLISLNHKKGSHLGYYFNSIKGKFLARFIKQFIDDELSCKKVKMIESTDFVIVHTEMPAVVVNIDSRKCKGLPGDEEGRAWTEAKIIYQGLRSYFQSNH
jgi:N-acetylmuramoyl-L-alanine amidase